MLNSSVKQYASPPRREKGRVFDSKFCEWPPEISEYPALLDVVHWVAERVAPGNFLAYQPMPRDVFSLAAERLRKDALAGKLTLGVFQCGKFTAVNPGPLLVGEGWERVFEDCRTPEGRNIFLMMDQILGSYIVQLSRLQ
jgi:hypothetical protein